MSTDDKRKGPLEIKCYFYHEADVNLETKSFTTNLVWNYVNLRNKDGKIYSNITTTDNKPINDFNNNTGTKMKPIHKSQVLTIHAILNNEVTYKDVDSKDNQIYEDFCGDLCINRLMKYKRDNVGGEDYLVGGEDYLVVDIYKNLFKDDRQPDDINFNFRALYIMDIISNLTFPSFNKHTRKDDNDEC